MTPQLWQATLAWQRLAMKQTQMLMASGFVIQQRSMQMALGMMRPEEMARMVFEKPSAFALGIERGMRAGAANRGYAAIMNAALSPVASRATANAKRLSPLGAASRKRRSRR